MRDRMMMGRVAQRVLSMRNGYSWYNPVKQTFSKKQVAAAFGVTVEEIDQAIRDYNDRPFTANGNRIWDANKVEDAYFQFVKKHKRWPTGADFKNWRETGLPLKRSLITHLWNLQLPGGSQRLSGEWYLQEKWALNHQKTISPEMVFTMTNITSRRHIISRIGIENLIKKGGGEAIQQDDFGTLWDMPSDGVDTRMRYVEVVNSTPRIDEKTGEYVKDKATGEFVYDHYFLRVPPTTLTAREAVAWTSHQDTETFAGFVAQS